MKKLIATTLASTLIGVAAFAQGTVTFANLGVGLNAPLFEADGSTKVGAGYMAQLLAGPVGGSLSPVGSAVAVASGVPAGYFNGGVVTVPTVAPNTLAAFTVEVWQSTFSSFALAQANGAINTWGLSAQGTAYLGGAGTPQGPPGNLAAGNNGSTGLKSFNLTTGVPEPSTFALAGLGAVALLLFRRRN